MSCTPVDRCITRATCGAIDVCSNLTKAGGLFVFAIYKRTPLCAFGTVEKRFYRAAPRPIQRAILALFKPAYYATKLASF